MSNGARITISHLESEFQQAWVGAVRPESIAADAWAHALVRAATGLTTPEKVDLQRRLTEDQAKVLIEFAWRSSDKARADKDPEHLVDAVLALELEGLSDPDPVMSGLSFADLKVPFHAAQATAGSMRPLLDQVSPLLETKIADHVATMVDDWEEFPFLMSGVQFELGPDGGGHYVRPTGDAILKAYGIVPPEPQREDSV